MYLYPSWWAVCGPGGERTCSVTKQIRLGRSCAFFPILGDGRTDAVICETSLSNSLRLVTCLSLWAIALCLLSLRGNPPSQPASALQRCRLAQTGNCGWYLPHSGMDPVQCGLVCFECRGNCNILRFGIVIKIGAITATIYVISI